MRSLALASAAGMLTLAPACGAVGAAGDASSLSLQPADARDGQLEARPTLHHLLEAMSTESTHPFVLFDRHIEKNGGLSMHTAMEKSQDSSAAAHCAKLFGYQLYDEVWPQMTALLQSNQNVCVDGHSPVPPDWLRRVRALRNVTTGTDVPPPRVLTTLRIRKPPAQYHSFYEWDQVPRMAHKWATNRSLLEYVGMTPDLQASILLDSGSAEAAQHRHMPTTPLNTSMCDRALATAAGVDLLTTTEAMGEMWPVLRRLTGLALPEETIHEDPKVFGCCGPAGTASLAVDEVEEATRRVAPCDWQLYEMAQQSTQRLLGEWKAL